MTKPALFPTVIFRIPRFPFDTSARESWNELKECIKVSSPEFHQVIEGMSYDDLRLADLKIRLTVRKYYNRSAFRSTPFGLFSTVGVAGMDFGMRSLQLERDIAVHSFPDWQDKPPLSFKAKELRSDGLLFFTNTTYYRIGNEIRYIQSSGSDRQLAAVDFDTTIAEILALCVTPRSLLTIMEKLMAALDLILEYLEDLISVGLIFTSRHCNIIGEDYFAREGLAPETGGKRYLIAERKAKSGGVDQNIFRHLPDLVFRMQQISGQDEENELKEFKERFSRRFELAEIPLMVALDPEAGVGYGRLEIRKGNGPATYLLDDRDEPINVKDWSELKARLLKALCNNPIIKEIELDSLLSEGQQTRKLPNTFCALCTLSDGDIFIDALGGASATAISGRFAHAIPEIMDYCQKMAAIEKDSNPDVLLFDVAYIKEDSVDNINRRPAIYDCQLSILNYDTSSQPISAGDILVSVRAGEVVLRSRSLGKRLIPRFASAYNYKRSDLPLFRLLMDVQAQGLQTSMMLRPAALIPGLPFYPRIRFRNIVVSPATWLLKQLVIKGISTWSAKVDFLSAHLSELTSKYVRVGSGDQTLLLDITDIHDVEVILSFLERDGHIYLEEAYLPETPAFTGPEGAAFLPQLIITLTHKGKLWENLLLPVKESPSLDKKDWIAPGECWLYFEIYGNPYYLDDMLLHLIKPYLQKNRSLIRSWFFIRYDEGGSHIRLRLKLKEASQSHSLFSSLTGILKADMESGKVNDIKLCTYKREVHRYSAKLMADVEAHFCRDSRFVINMVAAMSPDFAKYRLCMDILDQVYENKAIPNGELDKMLLRITDNLKVEHRLAVEGLKRINAMFREFGHQAPLTLSSRLAKQHGNIKSSMISLLRKCPGESKASLVADLMHMHINRLFITDQRLHELVIYEFHLSCRTRQRHLERLSEKAV